MALTRRALFPVLTGVALAPRELFAQQPKRAPASGQSWAAVPTVVKREFFSDRQPLPRLDGAASPSPSGWIHFSGQFAEDAHYTQTGWSLLKLTEDDFKDIMLEQDKLRERMVAVVDDVVHRNNPNVWRPLFGSGIDAWNYGVEVDTPQGRKVLVDCDDYALIMRRRLIANIFPKGSMSLLFMEDGQPPVPGQPRQAHLTFGLWTQFGMLVFDIQTAQVVRLQDSIHKPLVIQNPFNHQRWVKFNGYEDAPPNEALATPRPTPVRPGQWDNITIRREPMPAPWSDGVMQPK